MVERDQSPIVRALARLFGRGEIKIAAGVVAFFILIAIYAPFLSGEVALVWWDARGLSFPVFTDLFNRWSYSKPHDLLFNIAALLLPFLALFWFFARRRLGGGRCVAIGMLIIALTWIICWIPCLPSQGGWRAVWTKRLPGVETMESWHAQKEQGTAPFALFPLVPHRFDATATGAVLKSPGSVNPQTEARFFLGTDSFGRDVLAQMIFGARISLTVGLFSTGLALIIGTILGAMSGYFGGWVDLVIQRIVEMMMTFPTFILILVVVAMTSRDIFIIMSVIGLTGWAGTARLVRGEFLGQVVRDYVTAAECLGLPRYRIMFRHILPNALTPLIISATFGIAGAVGSESALSFIGLGDTSIASWGVLMEQGRENIRYGWLIWAPGLAIFVLIVSLNVIGNGVREALDPKGIR